MSRLRMSQMPQEVRDALGDLSGGIGAKNLKIEFIKVLSQCGWVWSVEGAAWRKGEDGAIVDEFIDDIVYFHVWALQDITSAIRRGAISFEFSKRETTGPRETFGVEFEIKWPDAVSLLAEMERAE